MIVKRVCGLVSYSEQFTTLRIVLLGLESVVIFGFLCFTLSEDTKSMSVRKKLIKFCAIFWFPC